MTEEQESSNAVGDELTARERLAIELADERDALGERCKRAEQERDELLCGAHDVLKEEVKGFRAAIVGALGWLDATVAVTSDSYAKTARRILRDSLVVSRSGKTKNDRGSAARI